MKVEEIASSTKFIPSFGGVVVKSTMVVVLFVC